MITVDDFLKVDIRVGTIVKVEVFKEMRKPSYKIEIDFGELGIRKTSSQITTRYNIENLVGRQILGIVNIKPRQIANMMSDCFLLGGELKEGFSLVKLDDIVENGTKVC